MIMSGNHTKRQREPYMQSMQEERTINQMYAVLNDVKCAVMNGSDM
jgi:hypothetical protein